MTQLATIFAMPLGQLLLAAVLILAFLALNLIVLIRELRRERDYARSLLTRDAFDRVGLRAIPGGRR